MKPLKLAAGVVKCNHGLTSIFCFLAETVELWLCCKVKEHKINICSITVTILRRQSGPRFCSIVLAIMIFQRFKIYDVPFLALDLAAFFAPACLCFAKQDKWSTHIWTSSLLRRVVLAKVSIVFSSISWPCLALLLNADFTWWRELTVSCSVFCHMLNIIFWGKEMPTTNRLTFSTIFTAPWSFLVRNGEWNTSQGGKAFSYQSLAFSGLPFPQSS